MKRFMTSALCMTVLLGALVLFVGAADREAGAPEQEAELSQVQEASGEEVIAATPENVEQVEKATESDQNFEVVSDADRPSEGETLESADGREIEISAAESGIVSYDEAADIEQTSGDTGFPVPLSAFMRGIEGEDLIVIDRDVVVDEPFSLPEDTVLMISDGTVTLSEGQVFENHGCIRITGGELVVSPDAELDNYGFIEVSENGILTVADEGIYWSDEYGVLSLDRSTDEAEAEIEGVDRALIEYTVFAGTASALRSALAENGYAFVTVCIDDPMMMAELGSVALGEGQSIELR